METQRSPWVALWTLCLGFFMILLDMTIVAVANPAIMDDLHTDISNVIWVTSAYLLAYAVPLLITGRLGDRYGPKILYLTGLALFTVSSLWCGLSTSIEMLIGARVVQGLGAAMLTPQTMSVITRIFPPERRGAAMGAWGSVAGVASLVGPIAGGLLVDGLGWQWIFFINVPIGVVAFALALRFVPDLPTHEHKFDLVGVGLSAVGMFLLVFGLQEGNDHNWDAWIWAMIIAGLLVLAGFIYYQSRDIGEPLVPLALFKIRNFALSNVGITAMGAAMTSLMLPAFFYLEAVRDLSPTKSALVFAPTAVFSGVLAPIVGRWVDKAHPRVIPTIGFAMAAIAIAWLAERMHPDAPIWTMMFPIILLGISMACIWAPLSATATHDLPLDQAGAGSGIYNTTRQVGSVLGSAAISALITARMSANGLHSSTNQNSGALPAFVVHPFSSALAESMLLPAAILVVGCCASALFARHAKDKAARQAAAAPAEVVA
ncbi:DHA2 family efflux MFS transporter permease subunit [Skermania sp. ID1734]|uniref:DHA2 family efflux MFS transporter permease subunit n=1 Tax=Skermania sp. ID1734 TaxID=2597516 RepID=UPI00117C73AA|nr:DHA2 family efflux MFS transporter permease subunit [Skermania sp. ID1734]TSE01874.1 DHA2 family efflux MFS transporter permease subunit [Skermania sp. ID1734]